MLNDECDRSYFQAHSQHQVTFLTNQLVNQSTYQLINQSTCQPINFSTNQLFNRSTNQLFNQSTNQLINQYLNTQIPNPQLQTHTTLPRDKIFMSVFNRKGLYFATRNFDHVIEYALTGFFNSLFTFDDCSGIDINNITHFIV